MLYQLPNGKVLYLSTEEYLSLDDKELHELTHSGYGDEPSYNMYYGSKAKPAEPPVNKQADLDYSPESEDTDTSGPLNMHALPEE